MTIPTPRPYGFRLLAPLLVLGFLVGSAGSAAAEGPVTQFLKDKHGQVARLLKAPARDKGALSNRDEKITGIIAGLLDYGTLSEKALADQWKVRNEKERAEFVALLQKLVERNYRQNLSSTLDYAIKYVDERAAAENGIQVVTKARDAKNKRAPEVEIQYLLEPRGNAWAVVDVTTDGVSMVANYRSQFRRIIEKDGWDGLIERMKKRLDEGSELL